MPKEITSGGSATMVDGSNSTHNTDRIITGTRSEEVITIDSKNMAASREDCRDRDTTGAGHDWVSNESRSSESIQSKMSCSSGVVSAKKNDSAAGKAEDAQCAPTADQARRASTTSRFKEKRPEPLKLSSNMNQDIPLDLSVKSAGNIPSGVLGNIFNMDPLNPMAPLETPRIQWQDNDSLLASTKSRLFSSSTNASHRARISSVIGESPPITPNTPLMDVMFSSTAAASIHRLPSDPSYSAILALESPLHSFLTSPFDLDKLHILDKLSQSSKQEYQPSRIEVLKGVPRRSCSSDNLQHSAGGPGQTGPDEAAANRSRARQDHGQTSNNLGVNQKKNSISPLATRSFSNTNSGFNSPTKFSYTNHQQTTSNLNESHHSPTSNSNGKSLTPTSAATVNLFNIHLNSPNGSSRQSPVDPSLSNSRLGAGHQKNKSPSFPSLDQEACFLDMSSSIMYSQQQQNSARAPLLGFSLNSNGTDQNNNNQVTCVDHYNRQQSNPSISATLNTPTLISPGQMIANQLGLLPSPTLSPMSSVFDIPSPFLMFSSSAAQMNLQPENQASISSENKPAAPAKQCVQTQKIDVHKRMKSDPRQIDKDSAQPNATCREKANPSKGTAVETMRERTSADVIQPTEHDSIKNDLSQLITPAEEKTAACSKPNELVQLGQDGDMDQDVDMAIEGGSRQLTSSANIPTRETNFGNEMRPSTVIPHICISYHTHTKSLSNLQENQPKPSKLSHQPSAMSDSNCLGMLESTNPNGMRNHGRHRERNLLCKRSLSPRTFHARVRSYHRERLESSSAPPDVHQRRRRSKIKTATTANADSCFELADNKSPGDKLDKITAATLITSPSGDDKPPALSQSTSCLHQTQNNRNDPNGPYPGVPSRFTAANHQFASQANVSGDNSFWNGRSSSAGPAIYAGNHSHNKIAHCAAPNGYTENSTNFPAQHNASNFYTGHANQPNFINQQEQRQQAAPLQEIASEPQIETNHRFQATNPPHQQLHHHSLSNQHFQNTLHANNYDHHNQNQPHLRPHTAQQLYSMSASDLQRPQYSRSVCQTQQQQQQLSISNSSTMGRVDQVTLPQRAPSYQQIHQQIQNQNHNIQQQTFHQGGVQIMPTSVGPMNTWSRAGNRLICEPQYSNQPNPNSAQTNTLINQIGGLQPATAQILCRKFDSTNLPNPYEPMAHISVGSDMAPSKGPTPVLACSNSSQQRDLELVERPSSHMIEIESRSESRSNSSLDFASPFAGSNGSRSNSAASSNLSAKKYHCDQCSKSFTRSDMLTRHRRLHSGDRPFQCTECKQEFSRSDHLSTHMRTHTGEKPYKCKLCTYSACRKDMITRHLKVHNRSPNMAE